MTMNCQYCGRGCDDDDDEYELQQQADVRECAKAIRAVFAIASSGGDLHCEISDGNIDCVSDWNIGMMRREKMPLNKKRFSYKMLENAERACIAAMEGLSLDERYAALNLAHSKEQL